MDAAVVSRLVDLNHQFYQTFAAEFAATRQRLQPGVSAQLDRLLAARSLVDIGCGSGELARRLLAAGFAGDYTGLDFSEKLLDHARRMVAVSFPTGGGPGRIRFLTADLARPGWENAAGDARAEAVLGFAVLHHLPGAELHLRTLKAVHRLLRPGGHFYFSVWQFRASEKLAARIVPWEEIGLSEGEVDAGDALLDWRAGGRGLRYVHEFNKGELAALAHQSGFEVMQSFFADGREGNLALYQDWRKL